MTALDGINLYIYLKVNKFLLKHYYSIVEFNGLVYLLQLDSSHRDLCLWESVIYVLFFRRQFLILFLLVQLDFNSDLLGLCLRLRNLRNF